MKQKIFVILSDMALMQMVQNALEAFTIKHLGVEKRENQYLESYGLLWGSMTTIPQDNIKNLVYTVSYVGIDTSAKMERGSCLPNEDSLDLKRDLMTSFWPQYRFLGDFHSHPYSREDECDYKQIDEDKLYRYTPGDFNHIRNNMEFWSRHNYRIGMVITIVDMQRRVNTVLQKADDNLIIFTFGNYRMWIKAYYVSYLNNRVRFNEDIFLQCPYLAGMEPITKFGKHVGGTHKTGDSGKHNS